MTSGSIALPAIVAVFLTGVSARAHALSAFVAAGGALGVALFRPATKALKTVGIALVIVAIVAAVAMQLP